MSSEGGAARCVASWELGVEPMVHARERAPSVLEQLAYRLRVAARAAGGPRGIAWLDSGGPARAERSLLTAFPDEVRRLPLAAHDEVAPFLDALVPHPEPANGGFFAGGWVGFVCYRAVAGLEPVHLTAEADAPVPLASWGRHATWYLHDRATGRLELWTRRATRSEGTTAPGPSLDAWRHWAEDAVRAPFDLTTPLVESPEVLQAHEPTAPEAVAALVARASRSFDASTFTDAVVRVQEAIREGEVFQANIAHRLRVASDADPFSVFLRLRRLNPSPFACYLEEDWGALVSNSPERLFCVRQEGGHRVGRARPIAGTRPRRGDPEGDARAVADLVASPKERAEHTMLVDLARNDLGRVAMPGSVRVEEFQHVEPYSHVHHLVSEVSALLRPATRSSDLFRALFPGGTITGAPKLRSIELIDAVERVDRGPYTGSAGYIGLDGTMDLSILIRTLVLAEGAAWLWAGAGIVSDSEPMAEYEETMHKAQAMLLALAAAERGPRAQDAVTVEGRA